jgi:GxxExxY protein
VPGASRPPLDDPETYAIIGAAMEVHRVLGCGFLEAVYCAALALELRCRQIPFAAEILLPISYKERPLPLHYRVDFLCYDSVLVEVKALATLGPREDAQARNYLRASNCTRALILNFGTTSLGHRRIVRST